MRGGRGGIVADLDGGVYTGAVKVQTLKIDKKLQMCYHSYNNRVSNSI